MKNSSKEQFYFRCLGWMFTVLYNILWTWIFHFPSHGVDTGDGLCRLFLEDMAKCVIHSFHSGGNIFEFCPHPEMPSDSF